MSRFHQYDYDTGLKRVVPAGTGSAEVHRDGKHVATIWDTDPDRPNALYIDMGRVSADESRRVMASLQERYQGRLAWVANPASWHTA